MKKTPDSNKASKVQKARAAWEQLHEENDLEKSESQIDQTNTLDSSGDLGEEQQKIRKSSKAS